MKYRTLLLVEFQETWKDLLGICQNTPWSDWWLGPDVGPWLAFWASQWNKWAYVDYFNYHFTYLLVRIKGIQMSIIHPLPTWRCLVFTKCCTHSHRLFHLIFITILWETHRVREEENQDPKKFSNFPPIMWPVVQSQIQSGHLLLTQMFPAGDPSCIP